ncbi:MAG: FAD-binding oxidoreductase [Xanthomonadaceae bacterium]|nr:FAD-binding oxidoreductase [Xanthomonadaceae bacterium]
MSSNSYDTLIIGGGLVGSSVAMHLARLGTSGRIGVLDYDLEGSFSSSELNAGGVRATFSQPVNILLSKLSIEFFEKHAHEVGYRDCGYLWLRTPEQMNNAEASLKTQSKLGWASETWDVSTLRSKIPFIDKTSDLAGAHFAKRDGLMNPNLLKLFFREKAKSSGVQFLDRLWVTGTEKSDSGYILSCNEYARNLTEDQKKNIVTHTGVSPVIGSKKIKTKRVVIASGAWSTELMKLFGHKRESKPLRRQVCIFDCRDVDLTPHGMIVDTSGVYFHPEATNGLAGFATTNERPGFRFDYDGESFFQEEIWAKLFERSTKFERLRHLTGWAGLYEISPDETAVIGHAGDELYECHSFSGHGAMQSYAAGLSLAELMTGGKFQTIPEIAALSAERFNSGKLIREGAVI